MIENVNGLHAKYSSNMSRFRKTSIFIDIFSKNTQILNFINTRPVGVELLHAVRRTDGHDEADSLFPQFGEGAYKRNCSANKVIDIFIFS